MNEINFQFLQQLADTSNANAQSDKPNRITFFVQSDKRPPQQLKRGIR
jgi:hypothetical protein